MRRALSVPYVTPLRVLEQQGDDDPRAKQGEPGGANKRKRFESPLSDISSQAGTEGGRRGPMHNDMPSSSGQHLKGDDTSGYSVDHVNFEERGTGLEGVSGISYPGFAQIHSNVGAPLGFPGSHEGKHDMNAHMGLHGGQRGGMKKAYSAYTPGDHAYAQRQFGQGGAYRGGGGGGSGGGTPGYQFERGAGLGGDMPGHHFEQQPKGLFQDHEGVRSETSPAGADAPFGMSHEFTSVHDLEGRFQDVSHGILEVLGYSPTEVKGRTFYNFIHSDDRPVFADTHKRLLVAWENARNSHMVMLRRFITKRGNTVFLKLSLKIGFHPQLGNVMYNHALWIPLDSAMDLQNVSMNLFEGPGLLGDLKTAHSWLRFEYMITQMRLQYFQQMSRMLNIKLQNGNMRKPSKKRQILECVSCGTSDSPEWRRGPTGPKTLCNACGLRYAKDCRVRAKQGEQAADKNGDEDEGKTEEPRVKDTRRSSEEDTASLRSGAVADLKAPASSLQTQPATDPGTMLSPGTTNLNDLFKDDFLVNTTPS